MATGSRSPRTANAGHPKNLAARLHGFGPVGLLGIALIMAGAMVYGLVAATPAVLWVVLSKTPWRDIRLTIPRRMLTSVEPLRLDLRAI